ncbi:Coiled-coil motif protein [Nitrosotalea devaniterrae]|uniref:Coiled-coil motif protein n=1 Tax=Nitrosotalea devaniterrae TaxID=1078905 RepID=A0A128A4F0_9ARCH|nr:Coiled-coil motif protein [Candidatus Nitrosotalea devanaterra]
MPENNPDLREKIVENRGTWKKLQLKIPGLKEYRSLEDIRAADQLLRKQVSDNLNESKDKIEDLRKAATAKNDFSSLTLIGSTISQIQQISGVVQHSQQGSAGISPNIRIDEGVLNKLYEYDFNFVSTAEQIFSTCSSSTSDYNSGKSVQDITSKIGLMLDDLEHSWKQRMESVESILVTK